MQDQHPHKQDSSFLIGLFLGGIIGAGLIVLLGTEKGKRLVQKLRHDGLDFLDDTKEKIQEQVSERVEDLQEKAQALAEKGEELLAQGKALERGLMETVVEAQADMSEQAAEKVDETLSHIEKLQERGRESTAQLRKRLFKNIPQKK